MGSLVPTINFKKTQKSGQSYASYSFVPEWRIRVRVRMHGSILEKVDDLLGCMH